MVSKKRNLKELDTFTKRLVEKFENRERLKSLWFTKQLQMKELHMENSRVAQWALLEYSAGY